MWSSGYISGHSENSHHNLMNYFSANCVSLFNKNLMHQKEKDREKLQEHNKKKTCSIFSQIK